MGRIGVVTFPGTLDDRDAARAVRLAGGEPVALWHADADLKGVDAVVLPGGLGGLAAAPAGGNGGKGKPKRAGGKKAGAAASGDAVTSPMQGTVVKVVVEEGQEVAEGDTVVVIEAMKMEQPLKAHKAGTVTGLQAEVGQTVGNGAVICELKD